jgi:hypothetical protein
MSTSAALVVLLTTISFADGTPPEIQVYEETSAEVCAQDVLKAMNADPPVRNHPVEAYAASCVRKMDKPAKGKPAKGKR